MSLLRRRLATLVVAVLAVLATSCQADVTVGVAVDDDASGTVTVEVGLDADAVDRLDGLEDLRTDDLSEAGWRVAGPIVADDGGAILRADKDFADPAGLTAVLEEVSGPDGPYSRLGLRVERPFARSSYHLEGVLDGSTGVEAFADPAVAAALDGLPFGQDLAALEAELGAPVGSFVDLALVVDVPGEVEETDAVGEGSYSPAAGDEPVTGLRWETTLDATSPVPVLANAEELRTQPLLWLAVAAALVLLLVVVLVVALVRALRRRRRRRRSEQARAAERREFGARPDEVHADADAGGDVDGAPAVGPAAGAGAGAAGTGEPEAEPVRLELVVLGGPGTVFGVRDEVDEVVAFARAHGSALEYPKIAERYGEAIRGRLSTAEMWEALGVEGEPAQLDEEMLGSYHLTPGVREFVVRAREQGFRVAYLGDGPAAWSSHLRRSFRLDELVDPWVASAEIGAVLPEPAMFEGLRRMSGTEPAACLLIDERLRVLEEARALGYGTAWFTPSGRAAEAPGHSILRSFSDLMSG